MYFEFGPLFGYSQDLPNKIESWETTVFWRFFNGYGFESYLVDDDLNHHEVEDGATEDHPPEYWVRPREGTVGKSQNGDDHEVDEHATQASPDISAEVARVSETKNKNYRHVPVP